MPHIRLIVVKTLTQRLYKKKSTVLSTRQVPSAEKIFTYSIRSSTLFDFATLIYQRPLSFAMVT